MKLSILFRDKPSFSFFVLTFLFSWSGIIIVTFFTGLPAPSKIFEAIAPVAMFPLVLGPTIGGLLLTRINHGKDGIKVLLSRLGKWKVRFRWYLFAVLTVPCLASAVLVILSNYSTDFIPTIVTVDNKFKVLATGFLAGISLTLFEEIGWSGFAIPELRKTKSVLTTGLLLGILWGAWHSLPLIYGCGDVSGVFDVQLFYPGFFFHYAGLVPFRVLLTWLYENTESILLPWIMHATLTSCMFFILNISKTGFPLLVYYIAVSVVFWFLAIIVMKREKSKKPVLNDS